MHGKPDTYGWYEDRGEGEGAYLIIIDGSH